ncbi:RNA polymerase sigma factor [Sporichthya polymorpha]|uniref:RNA polymerase sigma factor n=1 Tax=Sporichthya polymorpha TaxID=35751 RepID=UPI00037F75DC|nr:RNA polymerase sigma factor [Sporichthya polymorpha]
MEDLIHNSDRQRRDDVRAPALSADEHARVRAVLYLNGLRGADLDDAAQDVAVRMVEHAPGVASRNAWACAVATRIALDRHRSRRRGTAALARLRLHGTGSYSDPDIALRESVRAALRKLDPDLRATVVLRYYADLPVGEIAVLLGIAEGTVKSRLHRAAAFLRLELGNA